MTRDPFMSVAEAAQLLNVHERTVQRYCSRGDISAVRIGKLGGWRILRAEFCRRHTKVTAASKHIPDKCDKCDNSEN